MGLRNHRGSYRGNRRGNSHAARAIEPFIEQLELRRLLAAAVGPDGYGYTADAQPLHAVNITADRPGVTTVIDDADDDSRPIDLGDNTFNFYGQRYTGPAQLFASSNGLLTFGSSNSEYDNGDLSSAGDGRAIAALWDDWYRSSATGGQVLASLQNTGGSAAPDQLVIQWNTRHIAEGATSPVSFQAILELNTGNRPGNVTLNYVDLGTGEEFSTEGNSATVGIKDIGQQNDHQLAISRGDGVAKSPLVATGKSILISNAATGQPTADAGEPQVLNEGDPAHLDGSKSSDPNQSASSLDYAWDLDGDGVLGETGADATAGDEVGMRPTFTVTGGPFPITLRVTDNTGLTAYATTTIEVDHAPPTVGVTGSATAALGVPYTLTLTATSSTADAGFQFYVNWADDSDPDSYETFAGDSTGNSTGAQARHTYLDTGAHTINVYLVDDAGGTSETKTFQVTVGPRPDALLTADGLLIVTTGDGNNTITLEQVGANARLTRNGTVTTYPLTDLTAVNIQSGNGNDAITIAGIEAPESIVSGAGNDTIIGNDGNDTIDAGDGDDSIHTGIGDDVIDAGEGNNTVNADDGFDTVTTGNGNDLVSAGFGADSINTNEGNDTITASDDGATVSAGEGNDSVTTGAGSDYVSGGGGNDTISTGEGNDQINCLGYAAGGIGAVIDAGGGDDSVFVYYAKSIHAGGGNDSIGALLAGQIDAGGGDDVVHAGSDADHGVTLYGGDGDDNLYTGDGADFIYGGAGRDTIRAGNGSDLLSGGGGNDVLLGQGGNDRLYGGNGDDFLHGQGGDDRLVGGAGADVLSGGEGNNAARRDDPLDELLNIQNDLA